MDRIEINGVWYVREDSVQKENKPIDIIPYLMWYDCCLFENHDFCFEISKDKYSHEGPYCIINGLSIKVIDKRFPAREQWIEDIWDGEDWFFAVIDNDEVAMNDLKESNFNETDIKIFKAILNHMVEIQWLNR